MGAVRVCDVTVDHMLPIPLKDWLAVYDQRPHPLHGFYSALSSRQLWRLLAVRCGYVPGLRVDPTDEGSWSTLADVAQFVGVTVGDLAAHLRAERDADPSAPMFLTDADPGACEWHREQALKWEALRRSA